MAAKQHYIGRFAPSPTGPLHQGSLLAALASYLDARAAGGQWLLRIEDLDPPREQAGATQRIIDSLRHHGLHWDGPVIWQSRRLSAYREALQQLLDAGHAYYCDCTRAMIQASGGVYDGRCRERQLPPDQAAARLKVGDAQIAFEDAIQGRITEDLASQCGDFAIYRRDGLFAYQLAVVVDDAAQGISDIVRGSDLLDSTPRQILLQQKLGLATPRYCHLPVLVNADGQKLSKQNHAPALDDSRAADNLLLALRQLEQPLPPAQLRRQPKQILAWAVEHWRRDRIVQAPTLAT